MLREIQTIRHRYDDIVAGISDYQMFRDIRILLRYIDLLHEQLAQYMLLTQAQMSTPDAGDLVN